MFSYWKQKNMALTYGGVHEPKAPILKVVIIPVEKLKGTHQNLNTGMETTCKIQE
jgi:hypothetical protein